MVREFLTNALYDVSLFDLDFDDNNKKMMLELMLLFKSSSSKSFKGSNKKVIH